MIRAVLRKAARLFQIKVYRVAICGNHLHFLVRGHRREDLQNFFRVLSGHVAQNILREFPVTEVERARVQSLVGLSSVNGVVSGVGLKAGVGRRAGGAPDQWQLRQQWVETSSAGGAPPRLRGGAPQKRKHPKNQRKFWALLIYSRVLSGWGREFRVVAKYIEQNVLEALNLLPYQPRKSRFSSG
jgi:hypothetical protein